MKTINIKSIIRVFPIILFLLLPSLSNSQDITYEGEINLPDEQFTLGAPRDIIYVDGTTYIYTFKRILVYDQGGSNYVGEIPFSDPVNGRFALLYQNPDVYAPDVRFMAHDNNNNYLYVVTPNLTVARVSTDGFNTNLTTVINTPNEVETGHNTLHGMTKLVYDNSHNRIYWFFRVKESNMHSWGSFLGIYYENNNNWDEIFSEYKVGNDQSGDYNELLTTFTFNRDLSSNDFYIGRRHYIEFWNIDMNAVPPNEKATKYHEIYTEQYNNDIMKVIQNGTTQLLLAFPYRLFYDDDESVVHKIYQINLASPTLPSSLFTITAPNQRIADAIYIPGEEDIVMCYANVPEEHQIDINGNHDVAILHFSNGWFYNQQRVFTNIAGEVDTDFPHNFNRPFKLLQNGTSNIFVSKKNDIAEIIHNGSSYYSTNKYYSRDNFFGKGVMNGNYPIILNSLHGIDYFSSLGHGLKKISHPVYDTEYNPIIRKLYLFNRLTTDNTGFYIYDIDGEQLENFVSVNYPIGDLKYNPVQNHILVSQYREDDGSGATILVFDGTTGQQLIDETINFVDCDYPSRMFVSPNGKLLVSMNMRNDNKSPKIEILNASAYSDEHFGVMNSNLQYSDWEAIYDYQADFTYNRLNSTVYGTISYSFSFPNIMNPYHNTVNTPYMASWDPSGDLPEGSYPHGKFYSVSSDNTIKLFQSIEMPTEIICADVEDPQNMDYEGTISINYHSATGGKKLYIFDCKDEDNTNSISFDGNPYDIEYCPLTNSIYVFENNYINNGGPVPNENIIKIHKVDLDGTTTMIWQKHGFASSITYNPYDAQLYVYYRSDEKMIGQFNAQVFTLDPLSDDQQNTQTDNVTLPFKNMTPSISPMSNSPHFNPYSNKAYFPNGTHSSVSMVEFTAKEALVLGKGTDWISIPRLTNNLSVDYTDTDPTENVFDISNFSQDFTDLALKHHFTSEINDDDISALWNEIQYWWYTPIELEEEMNDTFSYRGYQLDTDPDGDNTIYMTGYIKDPATSIPLYNGKNNWVGYFLPREQDIFDALGTSTISKIHQIKHKDYYCYKGAVIEGPTGGVVNGILWVCNQQQTNIDYGEMVQLKVNGNIDDFEFQWQNSGSNPREKIRPEPTYFTFSETGNYTPIIIELAYEGNPLEIGAFVGDSCVGAESVMENDSIIILRAYLDGGSADSITFQDWFGTKSSKGRTIKEYTVYNEQTGIYENKALMSNIEADRVRVSFKKEDSEEGSGIVENSINIWPNPASDKLNYSFYSDVDGKLNIPLFDINGKLVSILIDKAYQKGLVSGVVKLKGFSGSSLKPGIYFVKITMGNNIITKKLVVQ